MGKYVALAIVALGLAACQSTAPYNSAAAGGTAPAATGAHDVRVSFDNGVTRDVSTDYDLRQGDRVIMLSNGKVVTWGESIFDQSFVPALPQPVSSTQAPARYADASRGHYHSLAVLSDGSLQAWGNNTNGQGEVPASLQGSRFSKARAGLVHNAALRLDGQILCWGDNSGGQCNVPPLPAGNVYADCAVSQNHTVAIRSDGSASAFGYNFFGETVIPPLPVGLSYTQADAYYGKTVLLRSDGSIVSWGISGGSSSSHQHIIPMLPPGLTYVQLGASQFYNAALRSDGTAIWWGGVPPAPLPNPLYQFWTPIPPLPWGVSYVQIDGGEHHTALRRSDGQVVVCGQMDSLQDLVPPLEAGTSYVDISADNGATAARVGPTSTYVSFAAGCPGSLPATRLIPRDTPHIDNTHQVTLFDLPLNIAIMVIGWQQFSTPISLGFLGMPGCTLHTSLDGTALLAGQNGQAKWFLPIPNQPSLVGLHFYNQALVFDPAANPFGAVLSDAAEGVIGDW